MSFTENLTWRYATKSFDPNKKVSEADFNTIIEAIRMAPSSRGLQPYHLVVVESPEIKIKLSEFGNPSQVTTCDKLLVFCARTDLQTRLDSYIKDLAESQHKQVEELSDFATAIRNGFEGKDAVANAASSSNQAYLALGFALAACAELQIDSCPMGGFKSDKYSEILGLPETVKPVVIMAVGYRDEEDKPRPKTRVSREELVTIK